MCGGGDSAGGGGGGGGGGNASIPAWTGEMRRADSEVSGARGFRRTASQLCAGAS
jgi:hypothetical protein